MNPIILTIILILTDGPEITLSNLTEQIAVLHSSVSLTCGTQLRSNPQAFITWYRPSGEAVQYTDVGVHMENGSDTVLLNISTVSQNDSGLWNCTVSVDDSGVSSTGEDGSLVVDISQVNIGSVSLGIYLVVVCRLNFYINFI